MLDRALGEYPLPDGWAVFAAGTREGDRAVTSSMSSALANRFVHLTFEPDLDNGSRWALDQADLRPEVVAFLRWRQDLLHHPESPTSACFICAAAILAVSSRSRTFPVPSLMVVLKPAMRALNIRAVT